VYWPDLLAKEDLQGAGIYIFSYRTGFFTAGYSLGDAVEALKTFLELDKLLDLRNLIFVCHSMGGLIVRQFLVTRQSLLRDKSIRIGLFLIASPSLGSDYATWLRPLARALGHSQNEAMRFMDSNQWLNDLDRNFINLKESKILQLEGKELVEDESVVFPRIIKKQVVRPFSGAKYFGDSLKIPGSNHHTIAKPTGPDAIQHRVLTDFIVKFLERKVFAQNSVRSTSDYPNLQIKLVEPENGIVVLPVARDKENDVRRRLEIEISRGGVPTTKWVGEALAPLTARVRLSRERTDQSVDASDPQSDRESYAIELHKWHKATARSLLYLHAHETAISRAFAVTLELVNQGTIPANEVKVYIAFPHGVSIGQDMSDCLEPSDPPKPPASLKDELEGVCKPQCVDDTPWYGRLAKRPHRILEGPEFLLDRTLTDRQAFSTSKRRLEHGQSEKLQSLVLTFNYFPSFDLTISYRLHASNQPVDTIGEIRISIIDKPSE
jgi:hypothetical protein